jgi:hypothetical protein
MKKTLVTAVVCTAILAATGVFAMMGMGGMNCNGPMATVKPEDARTFFKETSDLRTEVMVKQIELRQEKAKATPDVAKMEALQKEVTELRTKIHAAGEKFGMPPCKCMEGGCGMMTGEMAGGCGKMAGKGMEGGCGKMAGNGGCGNMGNMGKGGCGKMAGNGGCGNMGAMGQPAAK